ncbi:MAG: topoisomerase IV, partial [Oscillospiraceae bacterium]|nr:topoisomerase IV [Oscillospiraceae bacterium]
MARKKAEKEVNKKKAENPNVIGLVGQVVEQPITETLETNYMPYAMSVIVSRAIPEIDGFKPSHRKLLYTMYLMNLLKGAKTKSANIVGQTMRLNPHGDAAIYETMVRLSKGNGALLTPFVDSKGNFGKVYSRDMSYAAPRYTEAKLSDICAELFRDIDSDTVDFVDNYDGTMKEPTLLPTTYPNILVSANMGIAVGMASQICGFNLTECCQATIDYLNDPNCDLMEAMPAPDFATGGEIIYNEADMRKIYETGRGSFPVRARWRYDQKANIIEIYEIPYTTKSELIIDKVAELVKTGKIKEISDMRDETGLDGLKLAIDLKKGTDPDLLMQKLFKMTTLQDNFPCNFNILIGGYPKVMGVREILGEWSAWRTESVKRRVHFDLKKKQDKLHLLQGLGRILLDIDKAIKIIRETEKEADVVPNLMSGFEIDEIQANYVAEIKLRNINREYILRRLEETTKLEEEIADLQATLKSKTRIKNIIIRELKDVMKKYPTPRRTGIVRAEEVETISLEDIVPDYPCTVFLSQQGYF